MTDQDPFGRRGRPWFAPRTFGYGYRPQTWQGYLLTALCVLFVVVLAAITGGHSPLMIIALIPFALIFIVARFQGRR